MRRLRARPALPAVLAVALASCADPTGPGGLRPSEVRLASGLVLSVRVTPASVAAGDSATVRVAVRNPTAAAVTVMSGCGSPTMLGVRRADGRESLLSAGYGCLTVVRTFTFAPGEEVVTEHRFAARTFEGAPAAPGRYVAEAYSQLAGDGRTRADGTPAPDAEAAFEVR